IAVKHVAADVRGEVGLLARINHSCLIRLSGLCVHRGHTYLVLEFDENGALSDWLHGGGDTACLLNWKKRVQVACDVASGLNFLHHFTSPPYVHKNLSSCNVLLDAKFRAKVSNFCLARAVATGSDDGAMQATRHVVGTHGYLAPEYLEHGLISTHLDVFTFGVILLELLSGKEAVFVAADGHASLLWEAVEGIADGDDEWFKLKEFMDPRLHCHYPFGLAFTMAALAMRCVAREPRARPSMSEVLVLLSAMHQSAGNSISRWRPLLCSPFVEIDPREERKERSESPYVRFAPDEPTPAQQLNPPPDPIRSPAPDQPPPALHLNPPPTDPVRSPAPYHPRRRRPSAHRRCHDSHT
ncbi:protein LYK5-like, partial [Miscanthus floridulus]|uniref:protein LYK5-like n=1 Tax=Miscanthus floridulus TaxID=154761 RepID=UPI00345A0AFC